MDDCCKELEIFQREEVPFETYEPYELINEKMIWIDRTVDRKLSVIDFDLEGLSWEELGFDMI